MKIYYNSTTNEYYYEGNTMTRRLDNGDVYSGIPKKTRLKEWGFVEVEPEPVPEPTQEELLENARDVKLAQLDEYDNSNVVNGFLFNGEIMWLTPAERTNYMITLEGAKRRNIESVPFFGQNILVDMGISILDQINIYAMECANVTLAHKNAINELETIEEINDYDFTVGYPEKLAF